MKGRYVIIVSAIILLNLIGAGYGYWNNDLQVRTSVTTGKIHLEAQLENKQIELLPGESKSLKYVIVDYSTIPTEFIDYEIEPSLLEGILFDYNNREIQINVSENQEPGNYDFRIKLNYEQVNQ